MRIPVVLLQHACDTMCKVLEVRGVDVAAEPRHWWRLRIIGLHHVAQDVTACLDTLGGSLDVRVMLRVGALGEGGQVAHVVPRSSQVLVEQVTLYDIARDPRAIVYRIV